MKLTNGNNKRRCRRVVNLIITVAVMVFMPVMVFADTALDDAVCTANKAVSAPAAMIMFFALLIMCLVGKKFYKK